MENYLFIDTETTGFKKSGGLMQEGQARVCQIAMILANQEGRTLSEFSSLVRPERWSISEGAEKVHGITDDDCYTNGLRQSVIIEMYHTLASKADIIVAHNENFDRGMMEIETCYYNNVRDPSDCMAHGKRWYCTMTSNMHLANGRWPKLDKTLQHYCNRSLGDTAHDAMADTKACRDIFFAMRGIKT